MKLNKRNVESLAAPEAGYQLYWDDSMPGLGVRVTSTGYKSFIFERRINGKKKRMTLGRYGDITPELARRRATKLAGEIVEGIDPVEEKKTPQSRNADLKRAIGRLLGGGVNSSR